jgi:non-specific serine/threonine protein kinase
MPIQLLSIQISVQPSGHLHCFVDDQQNVEKSSPYYKNSIFKAFSQQTGEGLLTLSNYKDGSELSPSVYYWREFAKLYMTERCHAHDISHEQIKPIPPEFDGQQLLQNVPPMKGAEYLSQQVLENLWCEFDDWICEQVSEMGGKLADFLKKKAPQWRQVGRVCFHLAENKQDPDYPFAFIATYIPQLSNQGTTQHLPLGKALQEYAGARNKKALINLLSPVQLASQSSELIHELVDSGDIYHPLAWNTEESYQFLKEVSIYETCGLIVRLPDWWKKRAKPKVSITIGQSSQNNFSASALLDFDLNLVLGDQKLSKKEWDQLMAAEDGLVFLKGQWIEVDKDKLAQALEHWQTLEKEFGHEGVSFIKGMRLLAGASADLNTQGKIDEENEWSFVNAGKGLSQLLKQLRQPEAIKAAQPGKALKANLRPYQTTGVKWLNQLTQLGLGACLADDMGLGKTIQIISLLLIIKKNASLATASSSLPSLLVLPASLLENWKDEMDKFAPSLNYLFVHPSLISKTELQQLADSYKRKGKGEANAKGKANIKISNKDLVITTYGMLLRQSWLVEQDWQLLVLDEAQAIKNPNTRQTKTVKQINAQSRIALTGTPVENRLSDLWSLFDFICPGLLGTATKFKKFTQALETRKEQQYAPLRKLVQPYILRRLKTDKSIINDLPDKTEVHAYCHLSKKQASLYNKSVKNLSDALQGLDGIKRRGLVLSYLLRFKQICNHPSQLSGDGQYLTKNMAKDSGKFSRLAEICEEIASRQEKVLIFTQFREMTEPLASFLTECFAQSGLILHGGTAIKKRKKMVDQFQQEDGPPFFVLSIKAGGTGLNLTAASHVIHFDRWWNPAVEDQATDRAFRIGQKNNVLVHKFICKGTIEEKIDALISEKKALANDLLEDNSSDEMGAKQLTEMNDQELIDLVTLDINQVAL